MKDEDKKILICVSLDKRMTLEGNEGVCSECNCKIWYSNDFKEQLNADASMALVCNHCGLKYMGDDFEIVLPPGIPHTPELIAYLKERMKQDNQKKYN